MKRSKHSLSNYKLLTCDMGKLVPVGVTPVLPGDTIQQRTSALIRVSPLVAPVMHPVVVRFHHWFVPYRILWDGWEDFITGGPDGNNAESPPTLGTMDAIGKNEIDDYTGVATNAGIMQINAWYRRAYNMIFNEWYRDVHLQTEVAEDNPSLQHIAWEKDYFTASRPFTQLGDEVTLPVVGDVTVNPVGAPTWQVEGHGGEFHLQALTGEPLDARLSSTTTESGNLDWLDPNLQIDLSEASQVSINDFRMGFALQRYKEARARYGSRYTEYLRYLGVKSSDARLQRPEYLGGGKQTIAFSEVLQHVDDDTGQERGPLGKMAGHGISAMRTNKYRKFFEEHGVVMTLMSVRPKTVYNNSIPRELLKQTKEDYYQKELEHVGQQEVWQGELFAGDDTNNKNVFGWNDRYAEYRHQPSTVAGNFRDTLNYWHMARDFTEAPVLNESFIQCDPTTRIHADQTEEHKLWIMVNHSIQARRLVKKPSINRVI